MINWLVAVIVCPIIYLILPTKIVGKKFLKSAKKQPAIYSANHQSNNDPIIIKYRLNWFVRFMAKVDLFKKKIVGGFFKKVGAYPVNRGGNDIESVKHTIRLLKDNKNIVVFPEGTRVKEGESQEYKNGLVFFALKTDCLVVPMVFRKKPRFFRLNKLVIGEPFRFSQLPEFKDVKKPDKDTLNQASVYLTEKMKYLKEVNIKEYKKEIKQKTKKKNSK